METVRQDLFAVASAAFAIHSDGRAYDRRTRDDAWGLWCLALELLRSQRRLAPARHG